MNSRIRRAWIGGIVGLALAAAIPSTAIGAWKQSVEAGFLPELKAQIPIPPPHLNLGPKDSKVGTLYTRLLLSPNGDAGPPPSVGVIDIHAPEELTFKTKGLPQCDPATITGRGAEEARNLCSDSVLGQGHATAAIIGTPVRVAGDTTLFNGTPQNGFPTVLFHSTAGGLPIVLVAEMQQSPLPGHGTLFHTLVAISAGGAVPDGTPIVDTDFTLSKKYTDKKLAKKAKKAKKKGNTKKAKKLKKKSKVSWVVARCGDGVGTTRVETTYVSGSGPQVATTEQSCD